MRRWTLDEGLDQWTRCPLIKAALGDAAPAGIAVAFDPSTCPLIKAALGDAANVPGDAVTSLAWCPLIKAALGDAAPRSRSKPASQCCVH